jgi:phosphoglycerate dehydrogenase-like enzyme
VSRSRPVIVVVVAPDADEPPGLGPVAARADLRLVRTAAEAGRALDGADALAVYDFRTTVVRELGDDAGDLPWIHAASAGVDAVLTPPVVAGDTVVTNAQGVFDGPIAEWVLTVLLAFAKDLPRTLALQREATWRHRETDRVAGRRVLVVGAGSIGRAVARACGAIGMRVRGVAGRARPDDPDFEAVVGADGLHDELAGADDVVVATPLTAATHHLLDATALAALPRGARLVNVGRGPVVDQDALLDALERGQVAAAALDVFESEPLDPDHPFWSMEQVIVSPHMSGDVRGWEEALGAQLAANVERFVAGTPLEHTVDKHRLAGGAP